MVVLHKAGGYAILGSGGIEENGILFSNASYRGEKQMNDVEERPAPSLLS